jgi:hypothetical protein
LSSTTIARSGQETTTEPLPEYVLRGLGLFEIRREDLRYLGGGKWLIPSGSESGKAYEVRVGVRRESRCECVGYQHHHHCSHIVAAERAHCLSGTCDCCGERCWWPELRSVEEDDGLLGWHPGDVICEDCIREGAWA